MKIVLIFDNSINYLQKKTPKDCRHRLLDPQGSGTKGDYLKPGGGQHLHLKRDKTTFGADGYQNGHSTRKRQQSGFGLGM